MDDETSASRTTADCSAFGRALGSVSDAMVSAIRGPLSAAASGLRLFVVRGLMLTGGEGVGACVCSREARVWVHVCAVVGTD